MVRKVVASVVLAVGMTVTAVALPASAAPAKAAPGGGTVSIMCVVCWPEIAAK
ncbi:hypothetical protein [Georgenia subflava]|uniref:hypothetical protein n=1 Tax=Georgenia subflava TaxID=1622177 RepID=UPI00186AD354|nr:hypothetical protein [Georgenia subflava]